MTKEEVQGAISQLDADGMTITYDHILAKLNGGSRRDLAAHLAQIRRGSSAVDPSNASDVYAHWGAEADRLREELTALSQSRDIAALDDLASVKAKIEHIESQLPTLAQEAEDYEKQQREAHNRAVAGPRWKDAAQAKLAARGKMVLAAMALTEAFDVYAKAHLEQSYLLSTLPIPAPERAVYGGMLAQLATALQAAVNYDEQGGQRSWGMRALRTFDAIGCRSELPDGTIYG